MKAARKSPSGRNTRRISTSAPGRSLTLSSTPAEITRSKLASAKGRWSSSHWTPPLALAKAKPASALMIVRRDGEACGKRTVMAAQDQHIVKNRASPSPAARPVRRRNARSGRHGRQRRAPPDRAGMRRKCAVENLGAFHRRRLCRRGSCVTRWAMGLASGLKAVIGAGVAFALPPRCPGCGVVTPDVHRFCVTCWSALDFLGDPQCARPAASRSTIDRGAGRAVRRLPCRSAGRSTAMRAAVAYGAIARGVALKLKYGRRPGLARNHGAADARLHADARASGCSCRCRSTGGGSGGAAITSRR